MVSMQICRQPFHWYDDLPVSVFNLTNSKIYIVPYIPHLNFFLASRGKIAGKICQNLNFAINYIRNVLCSFGQHFLAAFWQLFSGIPTWLSWLSQFWLFFTILAMWLSTYTNQRQPSGVSLKRVTKMLLKNVDQMNIGHSI